MGVPVLPPPSASGKSAPENLMYVGGEVPASPCEGGEVPTHPGERVPKAKVFVFTMLFVNTLIFIPNPA